MRVLYGVQGTGNGHLARARALLPALKREGIETDVVLSGRAREDFFNMDVFSNFRCFTGLTFVTQHGRLSTIKTLANNDLAGFFRDVKNLDLTDYDLLLNDFEPVTAWAAKLRGLPSVGISHQCAFDHAVPKVSGHYASRLLMKMFAPTDYRIGLHWHHFDQPILPPLIEPQTTKTVQKNKILVYMGFEALEDIISLLQGFSDYHFVVYAKVDQPRSFKNIHIKPLSHSGFHRDLQDCAGVIGNAGFELASECLHLGKKLLVKPLRGQYEQLCNVKAMQKLQCASVMQTLDSKTVHQWLLQIPPQAFNYPDLAPILATWIKQGDYHNIKPLMQQAWPDTHPGFSCPLS